MPAYNNSNYSAGVRGRPALISGLSVVSSDLNNSLFCPSSAASNAFMCCRCVGMAKQAGQESAITGRPLVCAKSRVCRSRT